MKNGALRRRHMTASTSLAMRSLLQGCRPKAHGRARRSTMIITMESHLDHAGLTLGHLKHLLTVLGDVELDAEKEPVRVVTISFPAEIGQLPSGLWGPLAGDEPVPESEVVYARRPGREYDSRLVVRGERMVSTATVVIVHDAGRTVLATVYGGPQAPQEPGDPRCRNIGESREFWAVHALARPS